AMNDACVVCRIESCKHLDTDVEYLWKLESFAVQVMTQRLAIDEFRCNERQPIDFAKLKNRENVRLVQRRRDFRFLAEALHASFVLRDVGREHLQRNGAIEPRVAREINFTHAARAERVEHDVRTELLSFC